MLTVAIHLLRVVSHQDLVTPVPHCLPSLPLHFPVVQIGLLLNGSVLPHPNKTPLPSADTGRLRAAEGDEICLLLPELSQQEEAAG